LWGPGGEVGEISFFDSGLNARVQITRGANYLDRKRDKNEKGGEENSLIHKEERLTEKSPVKTPRKKKAR